MTRLYLITYLFINVSTALLGFLQSPNWRPSWRWYHWTVSMLAACIGLTYMFMISWISSLVAMAIMLGVYKYIEYRGYVVKRKVIVGLKSTGEMVWMPSIYIWLNVIYMLLNVVIRDMPWSNIWDWQRIRAK